MASDRFFLPWRSLRNDQVTERYTQTHLLTNTEIRCIYKDAAAHTDLLRRLHNSNINVQLLFIFCYCRED